MYRTLSPGYFRPTLAIIATAALLLSLAVTVMPVAAQDPPGNNTTVKIDGVPLDNGEPGDQGPGDPDNEPHINMCFGVDWYGFDDGEFFGTIEFRIWPPTGGGSRDPLAADALRWRTPLDGHAAFGANEQIVYIGEDSHDGGGSVEGLDASVVYDISAALSAYDPHANQGYHVMVTVWNEGAPAGDARVKHKVFWVEGPCAGTTPPTQTLFASTTRPPTTGPPTTGGVLANRVPNTSSDGAAVTTQVVMLLAGFLLLGSVVTLAADAMRSRARR